MWCGCNFPPDCTLVMTNIPDIYISSELRVWVVWKYAMRERLHIRFKLLMWKVCKRFNHFCVILSQVEIRYTDAMGGQQVSFHRISSITSTHHPPRDAVWVETGQLPSLLRIYFVMTPPFTPFSLQADRLKSETLLFDPDLTFSCSPFNSQIRKYHATAKQIVEFCTSTRSKVGDLSFIFWFLSSFTCNPCLSVIQTSVQCDSHVLFCVENLAPPIQH